jgi:hypothetical protein
MWIKSKTNSSTDHGGGKRRGEGMTHLLCCVLILGHVGPSAHHCQRAASFTSGTPNWSVFRLIGLWFDAKDSEDLDKISDAADHCRDQGVLHFGSAYRACIRANIVSSSSFEGIGSASASVTLHRRKRSRSGRLR